ncbi:MAG: alkaline phosphatase family protein, partial [Chloroflexi bacterium]|nr:alkaline phosphatase family protein [Chloroflexota bacterium]
MTRVAVLGLDCMTPQLLFEKWADQLPVLGGLMREGSYGVLESCIPPITVPAWSCMLSSKDPGQLGIYGFRNRADHRYDSLRLVTSEAVKQDRVWDVLARHGKKSILIAIPGTYPPPPVNGLLIADFLTPNRSVDYTYPAELKEEVEATAPDYLFDVADFRTDDKQSILDQIYVMTSDRFRVA